MLAEGGHGAVYKATIGGQLVAVKVFANADSDAARRELASVRGATLTRTRGGAYVHRPSLAIHSSGAWAWGAPLSSRPSLQAA